MTNRDAGDAGARSGGITNFMGGLFSRPGETAPPPNDDTNRQQQQQQIQEEEDPELAEMFADLMNESEEEPELDANGKPKLGADGKPIMKPKAPVDNDDDDDDGVVDVNAIATQLADGVAAIRIPDGFNLDDLQSEDPAVRRKGFQSLQQQAVVHAVQLTMPIMQQAFAAMKKEFESALKTEVANARTGISSEQILSQEIPAYGDPKFKGMIEFLDDKHKNQGVKNPYDRAKLINKMLTKMGVKATTRRANQSNQNDEGAGVNDEKRTLDLYLGPAAAQR